MSANVLITGGGAVTPLGAGAACWDRYSAGLHGTGRVEELGLDALPEAVRARAARAERTTQLVLAAAGSALEAAGLAALEGPPRPELGVVLGTAFGCFLTNAAYARRLGEAGPVGASPRLFAATVSNAAAGELAIAYRLGGPAVTLTAGGASGVTALGHALDLLRAGRAEAILAGGADALGDDVEAWLRAGGLDPGLPASEAAAFLVLESPHAARRRGARVEGSIVGYGLGFESMQGPSRGEGIAGAIASALGDACVLPAEVERCVLGASPAHAALESWALEATLGAAGRLVRISPKHAFGETFGAAGPLALLAVLAEAPEGAVVLVLDVCASGHVGALVARAGSVM